MAYILMAYIFMAYIVMAYTVMAYKPTAFLFANGICPYGLCKLWPNGLRSGSLCSYGLHAHGRFIYLRKAPILMGHTFVAECISLGHLCMDKGGMGFTKKNKNKMQTGVDKVMDPSRFPGLRRGANTTFFSPALAGPLRGSCARERCAVRTPAKHVCRPPSFFSFFFAVASMHGTGGRMWHAGDG